MKLKFIDSIRGIAILLVIMVHISQNVGLTNLLLIKLTYFGKYGVQLFFVASAYTLCMSAYNRKNESRGTLKFAIRRFFRIAPAYYLGIVIYFLINLFIISVVAGKIKFPENYNFKNVLSNIFFLHGFYPPGNISVVYGGWSIGTEMAFYAIFPFLFGLISNKFFTFKSLAIFIIVSSILCWSLVNFLIGVVPQINDDFFLYGTILNQLPAFLVGMGYYFYLNIFKKNWPHKYDVLIFALITCSIIFINWRFLAAFISAFAFVFLIDIFRRSEVLNRTWLIRIGQVSYSMYLWHFIFALFIVPRLSKILNVEDSLFAFIVFYIFTVVATYYSAILSEKLIEKPGISLGKKLISKL